MADQTIPQLTEKTTWGANDFVAGAQGIAAGDNRKYGVAAILDALKAFTGTTGWVLTKQVDGSIALQAAFDEAQLIGTPRQYTAGQGTALGTLTIASGSVTPDIAAKNAYSLTIDQNVTINAPSNDRCTSWFIHCEITGVGGWTIGLNSAYKPDGGAALTIPNTTGDKFTLYVQSFGDGTHDITIHTQQ